MRNSSFYQRFFNIPRTSLQTNQASWYDRNESRNTFISNFTVALLTLTAIGISLYYSILGLDRTDQQIKLSRRQFKTALDDRAKDLLDRDEDKKLDDKRYLMQEIRNRRQDSINQKQIEVISSQLIAIKEQAKVAREQLKSQLMASRPIFNIQNIVAVDTINTPILLSIVIENIGIRPAFAQVSSLALYNPTTRQLFRNESDINFDITRELSGGHQFSDPGNLLKIPGTIMFFSMRYIDNELGKIGHFTTFCKPIRMLGGKFSTVELSKEEIKVLIKAIQTHPILETNRYNLNEVLSRY